MIGLELYNLYLPIKQEELTHSNVQIKYLLHVIVDRVGSLTISEADIIVVTRHH